MKVSFEYDMSFDEGAIFFIVFLIVVIFGAGLLGALLK